MVVYTELLTEEIRQLSRDNFPFEHVIVFSSVILQRDKMVRYNADIRRTLDRRMTMWTESKFDKLVQEAIRCDQTLSLCAVTPKAINTTHTVKFFTRLILQEKFRAAMRWLTDRSRGHILHPTD